MTMDGLNVVCVQVQLDQPTASFLDGGGSVWATLSRRIPGRHWTRCKCEATLARMGANVAWSKHIFMYLFQNKFVWAQERRSGRSCRDADESAAVCFQGKGGLIPL